ncbi:MAG: Gfo/Idh/MocA family oxidoreductase [Acidobacteriota bacterium]
MESRGSTATRVKIAVLGAGLIGKSHIQHILAEPEAELAAIVDPAPIGRSMAEEKGVPWYPSLADLLSERKPDGVIVATPNQLHLLQGMEAVAAGLPALIEKPLTDDVASATKLVEAAEAAGVALLVGHHRRYNPMVWRAKEIIESGRLGRIVAVHNFQWSMKPDDYFNVSWRREKGAGPIFINLIHDMDLLRYLCGEVTSVQAFESNAVRGFPVEDTAVVLLRFANSALGTVTVSDTIAAPWSWELTTKENPAYHLTDQSCYFIGGTHGSLAIPKLDVWNFKDKRSWWEPIYVERFQFEFEDPLRLQIRHFCRVIRGQEQPLVSGREGLSSLTLTEAVKEATRTGKLIRIE